MQRAAERSKSDSNVNNLPQDAENTDVEKEGWQADELGEQSASHDATEMARQMSRADKPKEIADADDLAGSIDSEETPHEKARRRQEIKDEVSE
jgi:hypothetical protein